MKNKSFFSTFKYYPDCNIISCTCNRDSFHPFLRSGSWSELDVKYVKREIGIEAFLPFLQNFEKKKTKMQNILLEGYTVSLKVIYLALAGHTVWE